MSEWSKEHAWKVCIPQKGIEGSNPSLSALHNNWSNTQNSDLRVSVRYSIWLHFCYSYSVLKLLTGFAKAAFTARKLTVIMAMANVIPAASKNTHQLNAVL